MLRATCAAAFIFATLLSGCSSKRTVSSDKLKSAAIEIVSIASEGELVAAAAAENRAPAKYTKGHREYLRKQAQDVVNELEDLYSGCTGPAPEMCEHEEGIAPF